MSVKLNLLVVLILVFCQAQCEKVTLNKYTTHSGSGTLEDPFKIGFISYGQVINQNPSLSIMIESSNYHCIEKGQSLELTSLQSSKTKTYFVFKKTTDFGTYTEFLPLDFENEEIKDSKVCLFIGYQAFKVSDERIFHVYLNFLTDKTKVDHKDVLSLHLSNDKPFFTVGLNKYSKVEDQSKPLRYKKNRLRAKSAQIRLNIHLSNSI